MSGLRIDCRLNFVPRRRRRASRENRHIGAARYGDNHSRLFPFGVEILLQFGAQMPGLDADNVVLVSVKVRLSPENGARDFAFRDFGLAARNRPAGYK